MTLKELVKKGEAAEKAASESKSDSSGKTLLELVRDGEKNKPKNVGGFGGGLEYLGTKFVDGLVSNVEGIVDLAVGGIADLFGADEFAKEQFKNDWYNYSRADEKFNPGGGWKVAGDISSVVGGAAPEIALGFATGGSGNLAKGLGLVVSGASAAGRTLNEAVNTTGELGAKEWIGGAATGAIAAGIEAVSSVKFGNKTIAELGGELAESVSKKGGAKVTGSILKKSAGKALGEVAGETAEGGVKKTLREILDSKLLGEIIKQAGSEAGEEGIESILENKIKQHTYDPEASDITVDEVLYSMILGGVVGAGLTGTTLGLASGIDSVRGAKLYKNKTRLEGILESARLISDYEKKKDTAIPKFEDIRDTYESISKRLESGELTMQGYAELGYLERLVDSASADKLAVATARKIFANKDAMAEIYSKYYGQSVSGDELVNGLKTDGTNRAFNRSVRGAIQTNPVFRRVLLNNMIGQLSFDAMNYANSIYDGTKISTIATQENINRFLAKADKATLAEVGAALGISDWANLTPDELARAIKAFRDSGRAELYRGGYEAARRAASFSGNAVALPSADGRLQALSALSDGVTRYRSDGMDIAVVKEGGKYRLYDYESGKITKQMTLDEMNELLSNIEERIADFKAESEMAALDREIDKFAEENIPEYKKLTEPERESVRETIRRARANGASEADQVLFGRLAAKSGLKLVLTENIPGNSDSGEGRYAIKRDTNGDFFVEVDSPIFSGTESPQKILQTLSQVVENKFSDLVQVKGQKIGINKKTAREWVWSKSADTLMKTDSQAFIDKANTFENANELLQASKDYIGEKAKHRRKDKFVEFARGVVSFVADGRGYAADIIVGTTKSGAAVLYDLVNIQNKKIVADASYATQNRRSDATTTNNSILDSEQNVKLNGEKILENSSEVLNTLSKSQALSLIQRGVEGDDLLNAGDLASEILSVGGEITEDGKAILYHGTSKENAEKINSTGQMFGKEDGLFFSTKSDGIVLDYGESVVRVEIPLEKLILDDIFDSEAHLRLPTKRNTLTNIRFALSGEDMRQVAKYDGKNTVYIDAKADRVDTFSALLGHEMFHKMFRSKRVKGLFMQVFNRLDADKKAEVKNDYRKFLTAQGKKNIGAELDEEVAAAYAQELFNSPDVWDFILEGEPSLSDRIIAFFGGVPKRYAFADGMDAAAKRWLNHYKRLFNEVAELNRGESARQNAVVVGKLKTTNESYDAENADFDELITTNEQKMKVSEGRSALARDIKATSSDVKEAKAEIAGYGIEPGGIVELADSYFDKYSGDFNRTTMRELFLEAARGMLDSDAKVNAEAYSTITDIASELTYNRKDAGFFTNEIREMQRHIRGIAFEVHEKDKGDFDQYGGFGEFRKRHMGRLKLTNDGVAVDSVYGELQNLYGYSYFPEVNTVSEQLMQIAKVADMDADVNLEADYDVSGEVEYNTVKLYNDLAECFSKKLTPKAARMSKADADAYKARLKARAEVKVAKAIARLEARAERLESRLKADAERKLKNESAKLKADLTTDTVFSQSSVDRIMGESEALKELPRGMKSSLAEEIFLDMNESLNEGDRAKLRMEYTVKIKEAILGNENGKYYGAGIVEQMKLRDEIDAMMREISEAGKASRRSKMAEEVRGEVKSEESKTRRVLAKIYSSLKRIDDTKRRRYAAASDYKGKELGGAIDALTRLDWRGELNHTIARKQIKVLSDWYSESNPMFKKQTDSPFEFSYFDPGIRYRLDKLSEIENGVLKLSDLEMLADVTEYFSKLIGEYDMAYVDGKWQSGEDLVYRFGEGVKAQKGVKLPFGLRILRNKVLSGDFRTYGDSLSVMKLADCYQDGIFTTFYNEWQNGIISADGAALRIKEEYDAFMKKNPAYLADAEKKSAKLHGTDVSKIELIEYLMTLKRKQAWESIAEGGIVITKQTESKLFGKRKGADVHIYPISPIAKGQGYSKRLEAAILAEQELVESKLTARDKEYIKILEAGYLAAKEVKAEGDVKRLGFASVIDGYYYPIRHAYTEHLSDFDREMVASDKYASASFNKHTEDKAKSSVRIGSADSTFHRHVGGVTRYLHLSPVMDAFNKVYKLKVPDTKPATYQEWYDAMRTPGKSHSLQTLIAQSDSTWRDSKGVVGFSYLQNMMLDTMGSIKLEGDGFAGKLRSGYVGFALGANPKVLATQFSSLIASTSMISGKSHFKGAFSWRRGMDNYSIVARLRDSDYTIAKSEGVVDKVDGFSKFFTKGISLVDRFVVYRAWNACQAEVEATQGLKIGTEENLIAAGKLLDEVILNTQQNGFASRKTEGARRGNMLVKTILMFKSDAITVTGRVIDAWGERAYLAARLKQKNMSASEKTELKKQYKASDKKLSRAVGAVAMSAVYMVAVAEASKHLFGKADDKEEKEEKIERLRAEFIGNLIGGAPILSELHSYFTQGYDLSTMEFSAINDILATASDVAEYAGNLLDGTADERDGARMIEKMLYAIGQGFGVPFRNIKNITYGLTKMFNGELAYKWDSALYKQGYASDLNDAIEKGDVQMATTIFELALGENLGSGLSDAARDELVRLSGLGEKMIPSAISDTVTIDGEERTLTGKELSAVREKYAEAVERINSFIDSELYESYSDEQRASAVRKIYSLYKDLAYDSVVGTNRNPDMLILSGLVDADVLCAWVSTGVITSDKDENGKTIAGSKREKVVAAISSLDVSGDERLLLIALKGYALADGDIRGVSAYAAKVRLYNYIAELGGLTDEERLELYEASGFEIKNGEAEYPRASTSSTSSTSSSGSKKGASLSGGGILSGKTKGILSGGGGLLSKGGGTLSSIAKNRVVKVGRLK